VPTKVLVGTVFSTRSVASSANRLEANQPNEGLPASAISMQRTVPSAPNGHATVTPRKGQSFLVSDSKSPPASVDDTSNSSIATFRTSCSFKPPPAKNRTRKTTNQSRAMERGGIISNCKLDQGTAHSGGFLSFTC